MIRKVSVLGIALFLFFVFCSFSEAKSLKKGEEFYEYKGGKPTGEIIRIVSSDELEIEKGKDIILGKYTIDGERVRIVATALGTTMVRYYKITSDGLVDEKSGEVYYSKAERAKKKFSFSNLSVLDNETKLMWRRDTIAEKGKGMDMIGALEFIENLNKQKYAGYSDWRLPSKEELMTFVNFAKGNGVNEGIGDFFNKIGFRKVLNGEYVSSSTITFEIDGKKHVDVSIVSMWDGRVFNTSLSFNDGSPSLFVWPVRAGQ